ncbi:hypothetical protein GCM10011611_25890 [Aliidongia dinghuensis]|uniref:Uncharacterized protein n=1 Tax=Aliidongia dinghuensis TaxID=1867774 RepID=A0A8J2YTM8_9PROT|nr:hypothetical protein [Aliidongia dinghuensis]GGF18829.1 hypothetical protein GCM10011611_25890 [Aliidongia dinghuensis]
MSRFEYSCRLAIGPLPIAHERLRALHAGLAALTPELAPGDSWRFGLIAADRDHLAGQVLALECGVDPTEHLDRSIGWLLLAAHAPDASPHLATLAGCRLADRIEQRFEHAALPGVEPAQVLQAIDDWRSWTGTWDGDLAA